jgi:hypothetical protein
VTELWRYIIEIGEFRDFHHLFLDGIVHASWTDRCMIGKVPVS